MESSPSKSQQKRSESQQISFERLLDEDMCACIQENRRKSTSIIYDRNLTPWNVRCNDLALQEIRSERCDDASASGKIEGRKLDFDDDDDEEQEVRSLGSSVSDGRDSSFLNSSPCLSDEKKVDFEEEMKNGQFGASLEEKNGPSLCDENIEKKMDLVEIVNQVDQNERKSEDFGANLEEKNGEGIDSTYTIASPVLVDEKSGDFDANLEEKKGEGIASRMLLDEEIKKSGDFGANLEEKKSGRCGVSRAWFVVLTLGVMMILMGFSFGNFGGNEVFLVPT